MSREITPSLSQFEPKEMQPGMFLIGLRRHPPDLPPKLRLGRSSVHSSDKLNVKTVESVAGLLYPVQIFKRVPRSDLPFR
ncbi:hypothetical protein C770_GR4pC0428 (plasmid) [Sinorhizobium meliloti GR4]|nr:hypothetical protein C770_GR4pC0428 [Sinorhizobium meliloti GR4]